MQTEKNIVPKVYMYQHLDVNRLLNNLLLLSLLCVLPIPVRTLMMYFQLIPIAGLQYIMYQVSHAINAKCRQSLILLTSKSVGSVLLIKRPNYQTLYVGNPALGNELNVNQQIGTN